MLTLRAPTLAEIVLEPYQQNEFLLRLEKYPGVPAKAWVRFHFGADGHVSHLTVWNPRLLDLRFDRR